MVYAVLLITGIVLSAALHNLYQFEIKPCCYAATIAIAASFLSLFGLSGCNEYLQTRDFEYWGGHYVSVSYEEPWDERVPCSHPIYCTRTYTDSQGKTQTESYICGYYHPYDVDYHPPEWYAHDNNKVYRSISKSRFEELAGKWGNKNFVDMHRYYHSIDGDKYVSFFDDKDENLVSVFYTRHYENKIQATDNVIGFRTLSPEEISEYKLFEYPGAKHEDVDFILGGGNESEQRQLKLLNARLGRPNQVVVWILLFRDLPRETAFLQREYWKGGNKNEFVICVGLDSADKIRWAETFSWTDREDFKILVRDTIARETGNQLILPPLIDFLREEIPRRWTRKEFAEFDYLRIRRPAWVIIVSFLFLGIQPIVYQQIEHL